MQSKSREALFFGHPDSDDLIKSVTGSASELTGKNACDRLQLISTNRALGTRSPDSLGQHWLTAAKMMPIVPAISR